MFSHRFFMSQPIMDQRLAEIQEPELQRSRFLGFGRFAHDLLGWFEAQPALQLVKLVCGSRPELEGTPASVRIRHHVKLTCAGGQAPEAEPYALECLPWKRMGNGVFEITRQDPLVQQYLTMRDEDPLAYDGLIQALALRIDLAFGELEVIHDLGLRSAG